MCPAGWFYMEQTTTLDLFNVPWPISGLKCNQQVDAMQVGDRLMVTLKDSGVRDNLVLLLTALPDVDFRVHNAADGYCLEIVKYARE